MRVGINYLSPSTAIDQESTREKYRDFFDQVEWANDKGFTGIWITEHHFSSYSLSASPLLLLTKAAAIAPDLRLGTGILVLPLWDPVRLVADVSTLDAISDGRVDLGIGRGYQPHEFHGFGRDLANSREVFEESVELILQFLTRSETSFTGRYHHIDTTVTVLPRPVQTPHPPVWLAAATEESTAFAVRHGFHHLGLALSSPADLAERRRFIDSLAEQAPPGATDTEFSANRFVFVGTDPDAREAAVREVARQLGASRALAQGGVPVDGVVPGLLGTVDPADEALARDRLVGGSPQEVLAQFVELAEAGVGYVNAAFQFGALPSDAAFASAKLFAAEVLPVLAEVAPTRPAPLAQPV
ncbi:MULTISPECIES: LLM class flavin-dependent oxidoreductase [Protofrankia]|uniref:Luciferase-like, subgroup n=1 Tax=Candidatus Protofrankia datiscae TaxID=2716812 RepID=F8AWN5_9ACTN|nr:MULTISPECIES: LLM class flavin-dependent oxidoreductase [Protofrankia]AEH09376.1 Luciferase-like, subgroup [Candidatus Protofrankia datiscae]